MLCVVVIGPGTRSATAPVADYDIVVYGGTAAGVTAAVEAARHRSQVVLIEPGRHIGGMTSGGLGATDMGREESVGGLSREFYQRVKAYYDRPTAWKYERKEDYRSRRYDPASDIMFRFEPHVAELILNEMLQEAGVDIVRRERLDLRAGVVKDGSRITDIVMESGRRFRGRVFIDATYEGDLMANAGVTYRVGREFNAEYGETHNGNQPFSMRGGNEARKADLTRAVDPYRIPGDASSGLIFGVHPGGAGSVGAGDDRIQAYCFRLCTTNVPENRVPFPKPEDYDPTRYELLLRLLTSDRIPPGYTVETPVEHPVLGSNLSHWPPIVIMPNRKSDSNNRGPVSFDFLGANYDYPEGDYETRERIIREHISYQQGLIWFVAHDPRVPDKYRLPMREWGLAKDEFVDTGHWPHQLYVREARRMVGAVVMSQQHCEGRIVATDSVGLASYAMDSHSTRRYVDEDGYVRNEGKIIAPRVPGPYPIAYGAITPKREQCSNLLVPVCLSATHIAYGSIRMEPVFMILGHSAGAAAVQAIRDEVAVQDIDRSRLRETLLSEGQVLDPSAPAIDATSQHSADSSVDRPNIVLVMTDDQGWGDVGYQGNPILKTPNLDAMAASGVRFDRFYAAESKCSPTRASVLTGRHPSRYRCYSWGHDLPLQETTIAELLKQRGYVAGHFGKWHLGGIPNGNGGSGRGVPEIHDAAPRHPGNQGFDEWMSAANWFDLDPPAGVFFRNGVPVGARFGDASDLVMDDALDFIRRHTATRRPFFCVIWFPAPHSPWRASSMDKAAYHEHPEMADFFGEVAEVDRAIGRLRNELDRLGVRENTLVWFNSDNGADGGTSGPLSGAKGTLWEGGIRVPGILEWPAQVKQPIRTDVPAGTVDILPTICDILGLELPPMLAIDGISLIPVIDGRVTVRDEPLGFVTCDVNTGAPVMGALIDNDWKLLRLSRRMARVQGESATALPPGDYLFDVEADPAESANLSDRHPEVYNRLRRQLDSFEASVSHSAEAYPLVSSEARLRPVMLKRDIGIASLIVDRLTFPFPSVGWTKIGSGQHAYADGLRLQPWSGQRVGLHRSLSYSSVYIEFRFKLDVAGRAIVELGDPGSPACSAIIDAYGLEIVVPTAGRSRSTVAAKSLRIPIGVWQDAVVELHGGEVVLQLNGQHFVHASIAPLTFVGNQGCGLAAENGAVWLKDVYVSVGVLSPNWTETRTRLLHTGAPRVSTSAPADLRRGPTPSASGAGALADQAHHPRRSG